MIRTSSLRLKWPFGQTLVLALAMLVVFSSVSEVVARIPLVRSILPPPSVGTIHAQFEVQLGRLDDLVAQEGPVDCIFLGSSSVHRGIDPEIVREAYREHTGRRIRCFTFGVGYVGLPADIATLAAFIVKVYQPRLLVCETGAHQLVEDELPKIQELTSSPWIQYHMGNPSLDGWLTEHSKAYGYYLLAASTLRKPERARLCRADETEVTRYGYRPSYDVLEDVNSPPDPQQEAVSYERLADYEVSWRQLAGLEQLSRLQPQVQVLLLELPVAPAFVYFYGGGEEDYQRGTAVLKDYAERLGMPFWPTMQLNLIPDEGWKDRYHLNHIGAPVFSRWLGEQLGEAVNQGLLEDPAR